MIRTSSSAKSPLGSDSETPPALASIGCSQPTRHEPKWAALTPARPKSHNHCAELLALLWQILSGAGFPNQFFCDSWVVGLWRGRPWAAGHWIGRRRSEEHTSELQS